jgi:DNA-binding PadR family transcriptional regulator
MKTILTGLNKLFDSRIRLGIMSLLTVNESIDFNTMKAMLDVTDGNLASHLKSFEKEGVMEVQKQFVGRKPNTVYRITPLGKKLFAEHIQALEQMIRPLEQPPRPPLPADESLPREKGFFKGLTGRRKR